MSNGGRTGFAPRRLAHANLFVSDLQRSSRFYEQVCGLHQVFTERAINAGFFSNGSSHHDVALMQTSSRPLVGRDGKVQNTMTRGARAQLNHLAFEVQDESVLVAGYREAVAAGVRFEKTLDHGLSHSVYLLDPDGNVIEFYADMVPDWRAFYADNRGQLISARWDPLAAVPSRESYAPDPGAPTASPSGALLETRRLSGATLRVGDLSAAVDFYRTVADLELLAREKGHALLRARTVMRPCLALIEAAAGDDTGLDSLWFEIAAPEAPEAVRRQLRETGGNGSASGEADEFHVADPDGYTLLFTVTGVPAALSR